MFNFLFEGKVGDILAPIAGASNQLCFAIQHHKNDEVQKIVISGYDFSKLDSGPSPIHVACRYDNRFAIDLILSRAVSVDFADSGGNTLLHIASKYGHIELCRYLIDKGSSPSKKNLQKQTPYDIANNHTLRQYLLPLQLHSEREQEQLDASRIPPPPMGFGLSVPQHSQQDSYPPSPSIPPPPPPPPSSPAPPPPVFAPLSLRPVQSGQISPPTPFSALTPPPLGNATPTMIKPALNLTQIPNDGFHSSSSDPALAKKYGHVVQVVHTAPPPTLARTGSGGAETLSLQAPAPVQAPRPPSATSFPPPIALPPALSLATPITSQFSASEPSPSPNSPFLHSEPRPPSAPPPVATLNPSAAAAPNTTNTRTFVSNNNSSPRFIPNDGFHSSSSDPRLAEKYGHVKEAINIAPPPTSGAGPGMGYQPALSQYSLYANGGASPAATTQTAYSRYVAYDHISNSSAPSPVPPQLPLLGGMVSTPWGRGGGSTLLPTTTSAVSGGGGAPSAMGGGPPSPTSKHVQTSRPLNIFNPSTDCDVGNSNTIVIDAKSRSVL